MERISGLGLKPRDLYGKSQKPIAPTFVSAKDLFRKPKKVPKS